MTTELNGLWLGELDWRSSGSDKSAQSGKREIVLSVCEGVPMLFVKAENGYRPGSSNYRYEHNRTSHLLSFVDQQPGEDPHWIETQSWALVEQPAGELTVSWSRSVNNRLSRPDDPSRVFAQIGTGWMHRISSDCGGRKPAPGLAGSPAPAAGRRG